MAQQRRGTHAESMWPNAHGCLQPHVPRVMVMVITMRVMVTTMTVIIVIVVRNNNSNINRKNNNIIIIITLVINPIGIPTEPLGILAAP